MDRPWGITAKSSTVAMISLPPFEGPCVGVSRGSRAIYIYILHACTGKKRCVIAFLSLWSSVVNAIAKVLQRAFVFICILMVERVGSEAIPAVMVVVVVGAAVLVSFVVDVVGVVIFEVVGVAAVVVVLMVVVVVVVCSVVRLLWKCQVVTCARPECIFVHVYL